MKDEGSMSPPHCTEGPPTTFLSSSTLEDDFSNFDTLYPPLETIGHLPCWPIPSNPTDHLSSWQPGASGHAHPLYAGDSLSTYSSTQIPQTSYTEIIDTSSNPRTNPLTHVTTSSDPKVWQLAPRDATSSFASTTLSTGSLIKPSEPSFAPESPKPGHSLRSRKNKGATRLHPTMYECPFFVYQTQHKLPRTCDGHKAKNLSQLRTHLTRPGRGHRVHCSFLQQCTVCHDDFLDERVLVQHNQNCKNVRGQRRGAAADAYYPVFCNNILASKNMTRPMRPKGLAAPIQQADYEDNITPQGQSTLEEQPYFVPGGSSEQSGSITHTISHQSSPPQCIGTWPNVLPDSERFLNKRDPLNRPTPQHRADNIAFGLPRDAVYIPDLILDQISEERDHNDHVNTDPMSLRRLIPDLSPNLRNRLLPRPTSSDIPDSPWASSVWNQNPLFSYMGKSHARTTQYDVEHLWSPYLEDSRASDASHNQHDDGLTDSIVSTHPPKSQTRQVTIPRNDPCHSFEGCPGSLYHDMASSRATLRSYSDHLEVPEKCGHSSKTSDASSTSIQSTASSSLSTTSSCEDDVLLCSVPVCLMTFTGKYRRGNLMRHVRLKHATRDGSREYRCSTCEKIFLRPDALLKHSRNRHPELDLPSPVPRGRIRPE
ncbi:hypothetical protein HBI56_131800 [Parastagonospora nodorum]|nr:hypothetical protein HBI10_153720 [Parastagonospora nodorum]KAH4012601.1 hypothetical protein HBI13_188410 [Parastagonospora nodorum]KAH4047499.1 hypothetical protein HBH49_165980 [Parastagonospora nodorum]KAH4102516.1 hypothetical protein HBH46_124500 [Parastagonospora nodorum]KAH4219872.1 hypothetical protein HBI06_180550 [Parastagonospora nodorum]